MLDQTLPKRLHLVNLNQHIFLLTLLLILYFVTPTTSEEILSLSHIIKDGKSWGCDDINPSIAQKSLPYIVQPLSHIFNLSLSTGVVSSKLKVAKVTPILKSSDPAEFSNYRLTSVLTIFFLKFLRN